MLLGAVAVVGVGYYLYNRNKNKGGNGSKKTDTKNTTTTTTTEEEPKSNFKVGDQIGSDCLCYPASARIWSPSCCQKGRGGA